MKNSKLLKIFSIMICFVMLFEAIPIASNADWIEDGQKCDLCGEWDEDGEICDDCGCHYNDVCCEWTHCPDCGNCLSNESWFCDECGRCESCMDTCEFHCSICEEHIEDGICNNCSCCEDCAIEMGFHCSLCGGCMAGDVDACPTHVDDGNEAHCVNCGLICCSCGECFIDDPDWYNEELNMCIDCAQDNNLVCVECLEYSSDVCEVCGLCPSCADDYGYHCSLCGECVMPEAPCPDDGDHCQFCCEDNGWLCPECGHCSEALGIDMCPYCGLCEICCAEKAEAGGCTCGDVCIESSDWEDHFCADCGVCFDEADKCDECGLCVDCCNNKSQEEGCSTGEICVESGEWNDHFCEECGTCFCEKDYCDECGLCVECCAEKSECSEGMCVESSDYEDHFCKECGKCFHEVGQCAECEKNDECICLECCENAGHTQKVTEKAAPIIIRQPENYTGYCSTDTETLKAIFTVKLKNADGATYQWQERKAGGSWTNVKAGTTSTLTVNVDKKACVAANLYEYRCIIKNSNGTTTSNIVGVHGQHKYAASYKSISSTQHGHACVYCGTIENSTKENHKCGAWKVTKAATSSATGTQERTCAFCGYKETKSIPKTHEHVMSTVWAHTSDTTRSDYMYHWHCCVVTGACDVRTDMERHTLGDLVVVTNSTETKEGSGYRACTVCGEQIYETIPKLAHTHDFMETNFDSTAYTKTTYQNLKTYDENYHWKICQKKIGTKTCGYVYEKQLHTYGIWWDEEGSGNTLVRSCTKCGYKQTYTLTAEEKTMYLITVERGTATVDGKPVMFVKAGETVTVTVNSKEFATGYVFKTWDPAYLTSLTLTSGSATSSTITFKMPANKVKVVALSKECTHTLGKKGTTAQDPTTKIEAGCFTNGKNADVVCKLCGKVVRTGTVIAAYGSHDYKVDTSTVKTATCESYGYTGTKICTRCGDLAKGEKVAKTAHKYGTTTVLTAATCHSSGRMGQKCATCGKVQLGDSIARLAHKASSTWSKDSIGHWKVCINSGCSAIAVRKTAHADKNGDFVCDDCGYSMLKAGEYLIKFDANGGTCGTVYEETTSCKLKKLPLATKDEKLLFAGWYTAKDGGNKVTTDTVYKTNTTLYAHWEKVSEKENHTITTENDKKGEVKSNVGDALAGDIVTLTLIPAEGFLTKEPVVTTDSGYDVPVTKVSDTEYTFVMPAENVAITSAFSKINATPTPTAEDEEAEGTPNPDSTPNPENTSESGNTSKPAEATDGQTGKTEENTDKKSKSKLWLILLIILAALALGAGAFLIWKKKKVRN